MSEPTTALLPTSKIPVLISDRPDDHTIYYDDFGGAMEVDTEPYYSADQFQQHHINIMSSAFEYQYVNGRHFRVLEQGRRGMPGIGGFGVQAGFGGAAGMAVEYTASGSAGSRTPRSWYGETVDEGKGHEGGGTGGPGIHASAKTTRFSGVAGPDGIHVAAMEAKAEMDPTKIRFEGKAARAGITPKGAYCERVTAEAEVRLGGAGGGKGNSGARFQEKEVPRFSSASMGMAGAGGIEGQDGPGLAFAPNPSPGPFNPPPARAEIMDTDSDTGSLEVANFSSMHGMNGAIATQQERLAMNQHIWAINMKGKQHFAPMLEQPERVLDIGEGNGAWAMNPDFDQTPNAPTFIGHHPRPPQLINPTVTSAGDLLTQTSPKQNYDVFPNVESLASDVGSAAYRTPEPDWAWSEDYFDFVHVRSMAGQVRDWRGLLKNAYRHLKPGGYLEIRDIDIQQLFCDDGTYSQTSQTAIYHRAHWAALEALGLATHVSDYEAMTIEAGFENVQVIRGKQAASPWARDADQKEIGNWNMEANKLGDAGAMEMFTGVLGMGDEEARGIVEGRMREASDLGVHTYSRSYVFHARKPLTERK